MPKYSETRPLANSAVLCAFCITAALAGESQVAAQDDAADNDTMLEEIVVTSRRYEETVEDAPLAVNVVSDDYIISNRIQRADDLMEVTPGATWESFSKVQPVASMRGVIAPTPGNSSSEASIQTAVDNVVITKDFMKSPPLFDLARVEIMRGPQGTAFGRNASVGLVHFVTNRPSQEESASLSATFGTDKLVELDGHWNGGLSETVSGRVAFNHDEQDGPTESISTGDGLDGDQNTAFRGSILYEPDGGFSAYGKVEFSVDRDEAPVRHGYVQPNGSDCSEPYVDNPPYQITYFDDCGDPFKTEISPGVDFHLDRDILTFAGELVWNYDNGLSFTSITGLMKGDNDALMDLAGTPNDVSWQQVRNDGRSLSQEFRIDNQANDERVRWLLGAYFLRDEEDRFEENQFQPRDARGGPFVPTFLATMSNNETNSGSVFGEISYDLSDKATLTYGGRWVRDTKDYTYGVRVHGVNRQLDGVPGVGPGIDGVAQVCRPNDVGPPDPTCGTEANPLGFSGHPVTEDWSDYINKLSLSYAINDNINIYGLYSEGFKSGTFQPDARSRATVDVVVQPETSTNFEIGIKGAGRRARFSVVGFYLENEDTQTINLIPVGAGFTGLISNVGSVETLGLEAEGTFLIGDNFLLGGNFAVLDSELKDTLDPSGTLDANGNVVDLSGERPPGAPEWTYTLFGEYSFQLANGSSLQLRADVRARDDVFNQTSARGLDTTPVTIPLRVRPEVTNWGTRVTWTSANDNLNVSLWGKNLNEDIDVENFGPPSPCCSTFAAGFRGKRTYGLTASVGF